MTMVFALGLAALPAWAVTVSFNFDDGLGPNFEFVRVDPSPNPTTQAFLDTSSQELRIYSPGTTKDLGWNPYGYQVGGEVKSKFTIQGDFDITVDYKIYHALGSNYQQVELHPHGTDPFYVVRDRAHGIEQYHVWSAMRFNETETSDTYGKLRLRREGEIFYGYFWNHSSNDWQLIHSRDLYGTDIQLGLRVQNNLTQTLPFNAAYDNLTITADNITGLVPLPATLWLMGSGLLGLGLLGRRRRPGGR